MILWELFYVYFKIGLFTFGGGYAMIPMIQDEVIARLWTNLSTLIDFIAVSESTPGPFAVNLATFIGYDTAGILGAFFATLGVVLPSFLIILLIAKYFIHFKNNVYVISILNGLRPTIVGLIAGASFSVFVLAFFPLFEKGDMSLDLKAVIIFAIIFTLSRLIKKMHPIFLILISVVLGIGLYGLF